MANVTEKEYGEIKALCDHHVKTDMMVRLTKRGHATIARIRRSKDYEDYKAITRKDGENYLRYKKEEPTDQKPAEKKRRFYDELSDKEKIVCHYNDIMEHLIAIGKVLNEWMNAQEE